MMFKGGGKLYELAKFYPGFTVTRNFVEKSVYTRFDNGCFVYAVPNYDNESLIRAHACGYPDIDTMTLEHDYIHSLLALERGQNFSYTLWWVAHDRALRGFTLPDVLVKQKDETIAIEEYDVMEMAKAVNGLPNERNFPIEMVDSIRTQLRQGTLFAEVTE